MTEPSPRARLWRLFCLHRDTEEEVDRTRLVTYVDDDVEGNGGRIRQGHPITRRTCLACGADLSPGAV